MVSRVLKNSIFLRIYAGLVVLVVVVAAFCYLLVQIINYQRAQEYRESLTDGISYVISEGVARQPEKQQKKLPRKLARKSKKSLILLFTKHVYFMI